MSELIAMMLKGRRDELIKRGWRQIGALKRGVPYWMCPEDNRIVEEEEAFRWLERKEAEAEAKLPEVTP